MIGSESLLAGGQLPNDFEFEQNFPNPFNPTTTFRFSLPAAATVKLEIFNILGRKVTTVVDADLPAGRHVRQRDGRSSDGTAVSSGVYFAKLTAGQFTSTKKMVVVK